jgi:hypothetical protein
VKLPFQWRWRGGVYTVLPLSVLPSGQKGSRNLTGPKTLPTIWYTYMTLVTKYHISAINSYWVKCDKKYLGQMEGRTEVKQYTPLPFIVTEKAVSRLGIKKEWYVTTGSWNTLLSTQPGKMFISTSPRNQILAQIKQT